MRTPTPDELDEIASRRRWRIAFATLVAVVVAYVGWYREYRIQYCEVCASERQTNEWGFGVRPGQGLPLVASEQVRASAAFGDFYDAEHVHVWHTNHVAEKSLLSGGVTCGGWRPGPFALEYEHSAELRELIRMEIAGGSLERTTARRLVGVPQVSFASWAAPDTRPDVELLATAERLLRAHFAPLGAQSEAEVRYRLRRMAGEKLLASAPR